MTSVRQESYDGDIQATSGEQELWVEVEYSPNYAKDWTTQSTAQYMIRSFDSYQTYMSSPGYSQVLETAGRQPTGRPKPETSLVVHQTPSSPV